MADVLTEMDTLEVEIAALEEMDIAVGEPMEHSRVLSVTKNGKHVVSEYDLADVDVQPLPKQDKVVEITQNGITEVTADDEHTLGKVTINTDTTKQVMTDYVNNGGKFACYSGAELPNVDWDKVTNDAASLWRYADLRNKNELGAAILKLRYPASTDNSYLYANTWFTSNEQITIDMCGVKNCRYAFSGCNWNISELTIEQVV